MIFTQTHKSICSDQTIRHCILRMIGIVFKLLCVQEVLNVTHNQVAYWDSMLRNRNAAESNRISEELGLEQNQIRKFEALRNEYWTHKNYNWNESMFGFELFKTFAGMIANAAAGGIF